MKMLPVEIRNDGRQVREAIEFGDKRELVQAIAERYQAASRADKRKILDEFKEVTGFHRKHAITSWPETPPELDANGGVGDPLASVAASSSPLPPRVRFDAIHPR